MGYLTDECNRRAKEVAIRKVNGATVSDVILLLGRNTVWLVLVAVLFGLAGAYFAAGRMMQMFPSAVPLRWWIFAGSALAVIAVVFLVQTIKTWRIASSNPSGMLRGE